MLKMKIPHNMRQLTFEFSFSMFVNILDLYFIIKWALGLLDEKGPPGDTYYQVICRISSPESRLTVI